MKRPIKRLLKALWGLTIPLRRPVVRRFEAILARNLVYHPPHVICRVTEETSVLMDHMVRELVRLQTQVDRLREVVEDLSPSSTGLMVVSELEGEESIGRSAAG